MPHPSIFIDKNVFVQLATDMHYEMQLKVVTVQGIDMIRDKVTLYSIYVNATAGLGFTVALKP
jgi:hypothetical protein